MTRKTWTDEELTLLRKHYGEMPNKALAVEIGRSKQAIQHMAHRLGLTVQKVANYRSCIDCGKTLSRAAIYNTWVVRCRECADKRHSGENHHNWKGGVSPLRTLVHSFLKGLWIDEVMRRDNFTCQICHKKGGNLEVHHVRAYAEIRDSVRKRNPELKLSSFDDRKELALLIVDDHELEDGVTLCVDCHFSVHKLNSGELLGHPNANGEGNQQPSRPNVISMVGRKVQRLEGEDSQTNKPSTSARHLLSRQVKI